MASPLSVTSNRAREVIFSIYNSDDVESMRLVITHDQRAVERSVAYLTVFRLSVISNNVPMTRVIYGNINFHPQVIADSLQIDTRLYSHGRLLDPDHNAYLATLEILKERHSGVEKGFKHSFFEDYLAYRILTYISPEELLENLVALDNPEYLLYITGLRKMSDVVMKYVGWTLLTPDHPTRFPILMEVIGRLPVDKRGEIDKMITLTKGNNATFENIRQNKWPKMQADEEKYDRFLERLKHKLVIARNLRSHNEVEKVVKAIRQMEDSSPMQNKALYTASNILLGRYRYLTT